MDANRPTETPTHATHPPQEPHESCDTYVTLVTRRDARQKIVTALELPRTARAPPRHDLDGAPERHGLGPLRPDRPDRNSGPVPAPGRRLPHPCRLRAWPPNSRSMPNAARRASRCPP